MDGLGGPAFDRRTRHGVEVSLPFKRQPFCGEVPSLFCPKGRATSRPRSGALSDHSRVTGFAAHRSFARQPDPAAASKCRWQHRQEDTQPGEVGGIWIGRPFPGNTGQAADPPARYQTTKTLLFRLGSCFKGPTEGAALKKEAGSSSKGSPNGTDLRRFVFGTAAAVTDRPAWRHAKPARRRRTHRNGIWDPPSCGRFLKSHRCISLEHHGKGPRPAPGPFLWRGKWL